LSDDVTTEPFRWKILRMFFPVNPKNYGKTKTPAPDLEVVDPLERFEKSILEDSEKKSKARNSEV